MRHLRIAHGGEVDAGCPVPQIVGCTLIGVASAGVCIRSVLEVEDVGCPPARLRGSGDGKCVGEDGGRLRHDRSLGGADGRLGGERSPCVDAAFTAVGHGFSSR
jgi:hypothetical protein